MENDQEEKGGGAEKHIETAREKYYTITKEERQMKKKLSLLLALTLVLGGCSSQKAPVSQPPAPSGDPAVQASTPAAQEPVDLVFATMDVGTAIKQAGTMGELAFVQLVDALGTTEEEMLGWGCTITRTSTGNIKTAMQDGTADITVDHPPDNQANTVELTMNTPCTLWPLSENVRDYMEGKGWTKTVWAAGTSGFTGHDKDIETVSSSNVVVCRADLDEETAYQITKAICENKEALANTSSALKVFEPENAWITLKDILHPGAVRYYTEMGYMK